MGKRSLFRNKCPAAERTEGGVYCAQLAVPLKVKEESFGSLVLYYVQPRRFSAEEIELAVMYGDQAALAIENARLRLQVERTAVTAERNRIARDLHDSVTQTLFSASLIAEVLPRLVARNPDESLRRLEELRQLTRGALAEMRTLLLELRPATLTEVGMEELLRQLTEAIARPGARAGHAGDRRRRYAAARREDCVLLRSPGSAEQRGQTRTCTGNRRTLRGRGGGAILTVHDDGQGFDRALVTPEHLGLAIIRERSESIGAVLEVRSRPGAGTQVMIQWSNGENSYE